MAKRIIFAVLVIVIWPGVVLAQESIQGAQALYASAAYDEALAMLDRLQKQPLAPPDVRDVQQNRALCLLALGRHDEAALAIAAVVTTDPSFRPSDSAASPRVRTMFKDVRSRLLPGIIVARYNEARASYDNQQWAEAAKAFQRVIALAADPDLGASDAKAVQDYKVLSDGFAKLALAAANPPATPAPTAAAAPAQSPAPGSVTEPARSAASESPSTAGSAPAKPSAEKPGAPAAAVLPAAPVAPVTPSIPDRVFGPVDANVTPPTIIRQDIPRWTFSE
ncbi:MAG TPA: tetratricopeptide repeat protein, partial [Chloroflexota bacterium]|nr:tetratricopeptide repeat protein [Chloroflexota bacterium]